MAMGENNGYDMIMHQISQYDTIRSQLSAVFYTVYTSRPTVNSPRLMYSSHWRLRMRSHVRERRRGQYQRYCRQYQ